MGAGQKSWVQSQTTFAALARDEHVGPGGLRARVLKQKIWVEGVSYELQEIYGIDSLNSRRRVRTSYRSPTVNQLRDRLAGLQSVWGARAVLHRPNRFWLWRTG